ncbi:MAG: HNH endonuclease [Gammaproteobacteria bacterium]|nr:HNH endonuclease [Gammaproteobacteria bacterium]
MVYPPGSFSKNFGWRGSGLKKLHRTIRKGFHNALVPVLRASFRSDVELAGGLDLIPVNFFLHNREGYLSVDELVFQAIRYRHSRAFDRLALFAFHLNRAGTGVDQDSREIISRPAMWANEFVRERLWSSGSWSKSALHNAALDEFLSSRLEASQNVRLKCRSNFRHLFELCGFVPLSTDIINPGLEQWLASALFLVWDRHLLDGGVTDRESLIEVIKSEEIHKLLGVTEDFISSHTRTFADLYIHTGCLKRLSEPTGTTLAKGIQIEQNSNEDIVDVGLDWVEREKIDGPVERRIVERNIQQRDRRKAASLKQRYRNKCQFCGTRLHVGDAHYYSEAAHILGIGMPHNGPDSISNMLVLCPNHHIQFDRGILRLVKKGDQYQIESKSSGDPLHGKVITLVHELEVEYVTRHFDWFR